jgi:hypothetical protein
MALPAGKIATPSNKGRDVEMRSYICLFLIVLGLFTARAEARDWSGKVLDVFDNNKSVVVQFDPKGTWNVGDKVNLSYIAETMETLIGQYEITKIKGDVFIAREVQATMSPTREMKVKITSSQALNAILKNSSPAGSIEPEKSPGQWVIPEHTDSQNYVGTNTAARTYPVQKVPAPVNPDPINNQKGLQNSPTMTIEMKWTLGLQIRNISGIPGLVAPMADSGVYVVSVLPDTPADRAGILPGDIIFALDKIEVQNMLDFLSRLNASNGKVFLSWRRNNKVIHKSIQLIKYEASPFAGEAPKFFDQTSPGK